MAQAQVNGISIEYETYGAEDGVPLLLIMGLGVQLTRWPQGLYEKLVARGFRVIRFDNRDAGLSQGFDAMGVPNLALAALRHTLHMKVHAPYALADMAADALGVLDALGLPGAHVCGASMGGMIAQHMAVRAPGRVRSLTLLMTTSGARRLPQTPWSVQRVMLSRPDGRDPAAVVAHLKRVLGVIGSPAFPPDPQRLEERLQAMVRRAWRPAGTARHIAAVVADGDRTGLLGSIRLPVHVIHGEADPLIPAEAGRDLARRIPGATLDIVPGMGHDLPAALFDRYADGIAGCARRAGA